MLSALNCPRCGAPLKTMAAQSQVVCLYCNSTIRIDGRTKDSPPVVEKTLSEAGMAEVKQLLLDGQKTQALDKYGQLTGVDLQQAQEAITQLAGRLSLDVIRGQQLTPGGIILVLFYAGLLLAGYVIWASGVVHWLLGLLPALFGVWMLYFYYPAIRTTWVYRAARRARAKVIKLAPVGSARLGRARVQVLTLLVEVQPEDGSPAFLTEMLLPVQEENLVRAAAGTVIQVKYLPQDPEQVVYNQ